MDSESLGLPEPGSAWNILPRNFGSYELIEEVARGGMGIVYRASQKPVNRLVALKVLASGQFASPDFIERFRTEAEAVASLDHANIVPIYEVGEHEGQPFFSMRLIEGGSLAERINQKQSSISPERAARWLVKLARAVHFAHQRGILHRDIKPGNVLLDTQDEPYLTDFGLAKLVEKESTLTRTMALLGTPSYMSPEQARGEAKQLTTAVDVYGLGAVFYELLTGQPPFAGGTTMETVRQVLEREPRRPSTLRSGLNRDLETICLKCLEKSPSRRYASADALAEEFERWLRKEPIQARPASPVERLGKWVQRNRNTAILLVLLQLVLAVGLVSIVLMSVRLATANREKDRANIHLAKNLRDFEWQKIDDLIATGKRSDAIANLSNFLKQNPNDQAAATRVISMLSSCNFGLPASVPLQHGSSVNTVSLTTNGLKAVTSANDGKVRLWDLQTQQLLATLDHGVKVTEVVFAADERLVLTTCQDGSFLLWDATQSRIVFRFPKAPHVRMPPQLSSDRVQAALLESESGVQVWNLLTQQRVGSVLQMASKVIWAEFSDDAKLIAIACEDKTVHVMQLPSSQVVVRPLKLPARPTWLEFSPDGRLLAVTCEGLITFYHSQNWEKIREFKASDREVLAAKFSPDGRRLVTTAYDRPLQIWDVSSGQMIGRPIEAEGPFSYFRLSPDGTRLATRSQSGVVRVWDAVSGLPLSEPLEHRGPVSDLGFEPSGKRIVTVSQDGTAQSWEVQRGGLPGLRIKTIDSYPSATFNRDGSIVIRTSDGKAEAFDSYTGRQIGEAMRHEGQIYRMQISPDGKKLATAGWDSVGRVWNLQTGQPLTPPLRHKRRLYSIAFSPNGRLVATGSEDVTARLWDAETGKEASPPLLHQGEVIQVGFSPDSATLITCSDDGTARLWPTDSSQPLEPETLQHQGLVWTAEFSPDGTQIVTASADRSAVIWDALSRRRSAPPLQHERGVFAAHFSPDGKWILTCSEDATARVWDAVTGKPISQPMRHKDKLAYGQFSPDSRFVLTGSKDGVARLWEARTGYPVSEPVYHSGEITCIQFSPDGRRCLTIAGQDELRIWEVTRPPLPVPSWFPEFAEAVAGKRINASQDVEAVDRGSIMSFRRRFAEGREADFYSRWANWFLHERLSERPAQFVP